ncbi:MAG TPA: NUDIX hydrolase, partial [Patescibacteria group bacterium]
MIHCTFENGNKTSLRHAVVDIIVLKDNQVLLIKRSPKISEGGKWAIIGGFVDRDETLTEAATREVFEETGYRIKNLSLLTIRDNPHRPREDRQNIAFVFFCTALEQEGEMDW